MSTADSAAMDAVTDWLAATETALEHWLSYGVILPVLVLFLHGMFTVLPNTWPFWSETMLGAVIVLDTAWIIYCERVSRPRAARNPGKKLRHEITNQFRTLKVILVITLMTTTAAYLFFKAMFIAQLPASLASSLSSLGTTVLILQTGVTALVWSELRHDSFIAGLPYAFFGSVLAYASVTIL